MFFLLRRHMGRAISKGSLTIIDVKGNAHSFGDGSGSEIKVRLASRSLYWKLIVYPDLYAGEAYMNGTMVIETGSIYELLDLIASQIGYADKNSWTLVDKMRTFVRRLAHINSLGRARRNVAHHYDLSDEFYGLFLDRDKQYSCAYFEHPGQSLDDAQPAKKRHIAAKLALEPGMRVLDIGSGWGGLALYLAEFFDVNVVGVTLSTKQYNVSRQRVSDRGLDDKIDIRLQDYRLLDETFDRVVSVGMFEHLGSAGQAEFFYKIRKLMNKDAVALLHSIGRPFGPCATSAWMKKYIFPGGYIPAFSEIMPIIEQAGLYICDAEILRMHYVRTLREWRNRFIAHRDMAKKIYDERFCRMWEFYLASSEMAFRHQALNVFQLQMTKHQNALPLTRDYIFEEETRLRRIDQKDNRAKLVSSG